jgi:hypothetical protein
MAAIVGAVILASAVLAAGPASAQDVDVDGVDVRVDLGDEDDIVVLTGRVDVREGESVGDVVIFDGPVRVDGAAGGAVIAFNGDVLIGGEVSGDVVAFNGVVELEDGARIAGDLVTRLAPRLAPTASVGGERRTVDPSLAFGRPFAWAARFGFWLAVSVSTLVLGLLLLLLAPRAGETTVLAGTTGVGPSIGWGLLVFSGLPVLGVIASLTIVGLPFGIGVFLALATVYAIGYVAGAHVLGRLLMKPPASPFLAFLVGWAILRVVALVPAAGGLTWFAATVFGLGALSVALWRARAAAGAPPMEAVPGGPSPQPAPSEPPPPA